PAYHEVFPCLLTLWRRVRRRGDVAAAFDRWTGHFHAAYGECAADEELFLRHTYLAALANLLAWLRLTESTAPPQADQIADLLDGMLFARYGIENLGDDLFSWPAWSEKESRVESKGQRRPQHSGRNGTQHSILTPGLDRSRPSSRIAPEAASQVVGCLFARLQ